MKRRTDLYELIRAMSKSEKRYFTIDAQKSGKTDSRYLELFQSINEMEEVEEAVLQEQFGKNLSTDKNYLYEAILRSMRDYRSTNSLAARIREMILDAKYLHERGLYDQCEERLNSAKELAELLGDKTSLLEIIKDQRRIVRDSRKKGYENTIKEKATEQMNVINSLQLELYYLNIYEELVPVIINNFELKKESEKKKIEEKFKPLLSRYKEEDVDPDSTRRYYQCWALYYQLMGDFVQVFNYYEKVVEWWDEHPENKQEELHSYIVDISNFLHACGVRNQYQYFPKLLSSLRSTKTKNRHDEGIIFQKYSINQLVYHINMASFEGSDELITRIEKGLSKYVISKGSQLVLIYNVAVLLFIREDFLRCINWCRKIIDQKKLKSREDIQKAIRVVYLLSKFELNDIDEFDRAQRSVVRYLHAIRENDTARTGFEELIAHGVQQLANAPLSASKSLLLDLREQIRNIKDRVPLGADELTLLWIQSRLETKKMAGVLKRA